MVNAERAPLFRDAFTFCEWILGRFPGSESPLVRSICDHALRILDCATLALKDLHREERIEEADERLVVLRIQLRLAERLGMLSEDQLLFALESADRIGRQLGGWRRALEST